MFAKFLRRMSTTGLLAIALSGCAPRPSADAIPTTVATPAPNATVAPSATAQATITVTPPAPTATPANQTPARLPSEAEAQAIGKASVAHLRKDHPTGNILVGSTAVVGEYAVALAQPFGSVDSYLFLKGSAANWQVVLATAKPGPDDLSKLGIPTSLMTDGAAVGTIRAMFAQMNDPQGQGVTGWFSVENLADGYAKVIFTPGDPTQMDGSIAYLRDDGGTWIWLTAGTAFFPEDLDSLKIPLSVR